MKAPFPYFGGKATIAADVWRWLGQPKHYIEPFFGSGAVLFHRPNWNLNMVETVNDKDGYVANVWRSIQFSPDETAKWCDWPVNHADLCARKAALIKNENRLLENLIADDKWHDPVMAGYWIWAASCWIGSGLTRPNAIPHVGHAGIGVHAGQRSHVSKQPMGVHKITERGFGTDSEKSGTDAYNINIYKWFRQLSERLRYVRVVCGDWKRVCGGNWQDNMGVVGIFFDPPYGVEDRCADIYAQDSTSVAPDVRAWCLARGNRPTYRIVLAGYFEEHQELLEHGWTVKRWKACGGYGTNSRNGESQGQKNRVREALFLSPHCIKSNSGGFFDENSQ